MSPTLVAALLLASSPQAATQNPDRVIDVRSARPPAGNTFEMLWGAYRKAEREGDAEKAAKAFREIRRLRTERNVRGLEEIGLALVAEGEARRRKGEGPRALEDFKNAIAVDPQLPDGYLALAAEEFMSGPIGILAGVKHTLEGLFVRFKTSRGQYYLLTLAIGVVLLGGFAATTALSLALLLRDGSLLLHDFEERFAVVRGQAFAIALFGLVLLLPVVAFQGFGWLPFWWLALLFGYLDWREKAVVGVAVLGLVAVGPVVGFLEGRIFAERNPLFRASMLAVEAGPDRLALEELERSAGKNPDDRDLGYLLAVEYKKSGLYDEAAELYRQMLEHDKGDAIALNNLANIEFSRGEFQAAIARYKQGAEAAAVPEFAATFNYNLSLAHLQKFDRQPAQEARSQAERVALSLVRSYDGLWTYDNSSAVVDLGLSRDEVWAKFDGVESGDGRKNLAGSGVSSLNVKLLPSVLNRFTAFLGVFALVVLGLGQWRGPKMFTMRCLKCGTPFCKRCHLGASAGGLCTQCHHLFVVRDGVSGPARNQKLLQVQKEDERRERIFRILSLVSPGTGHLYAQKTVAGALYGLVWYCLLALVLLVGRLLPMTEAPSDLAGRCCLVVAGVLILSTFIVANRARPDFEVSVPAPRPARRVRAQS